LLLARGSWCWGFDRADLDPDHVAKDIAAAEEAIAMARRMDRVDLLSGALDIRGSSETLLGGGGGYGSQAPLLAERLSLVPRLDDRREILDIYGVNAWASAHVGEFRRAAEFARLAVEVANAAQVSIPLPSAFLGLCQYRLGEWAAFWETSPWHMRCSTPADHCGTRASAGGIAPTPRDSRGPRQPLDHRAPAVAHDPGRPRPARLWFPFRTFVEGSKRRGSLGARRSGPWSSEPRSHFGPGPKSSLPRAGPGPPGRSRRAGARFATGLRFLPAVADRLAGQAALAGGDPVAAISLLEAARATFTTLETPWEQARTELPLAQALRAAGRLDDAASVASDAVVAFRGFGAARESEAAEDLVASTSGGPS
jgi:hypothetical protein